MKNRNPSENGNGNRSMMSGPKPMTMKKKKNMNRLGGTGSGLSLQAFANAKSTNNNYNPALIKKKREFYKNAKYVNRYKKSLKQQNQGKNDLPSSPRIPEDENEDSNGSRTNKMKNSKTRRNSYHSLKEVYEKQWEEKEKARIEREATIQAKKEHREKAEAQRKVERKEMFKKTRHGQPIMKYRIQHLLQSIQSSPSGASGNTN
ncbi:rRNA-processing protein FYV7-like [Hibiscus syriacus]|uniref:rRNA-processing protein FYV7-like n=1 Tax=Hibiscus syriacus TaxID=106335 RepID=UPI0019237789|nr:rRNA-processing protein FYV7-like [Hibiscus syriacus]